MLRSLLVLLALAGCGKSYAVPDASTSDVHDVRVPIPAADPSFVDLVTPETTIEPGAEKMFCFYVANPGGELAIDGIAGYQGIGGHHISLMTSTAPRPLGTFEECTSAQANADLRWFVLTTGRLPAGTAMDVPAEMPLVVQFHYINATDDPILVRDVLRIHRVDPASVTTWAATMVAADVRLDLPPGPSTQTWSCTLAEDRQLLVMFGHMHEYGSKFTVAIGPSADQLTQMYTVDSWQPGFKDNPPTLAFYDHPVDLPAGTVIQTTCSWLNITDAPILFPSEMCFTFAYLGGSQRPMQCL